MSSALRSCLICVGAFFVQFVVFGVCTNFGLLYYHLRKEFHGSKVETALIGSFGTGLLFLVSPFSNIFLRKYGVGIHIAFSTLLCITSWLSSSYVSTLNTLILTYSVLWGCGAGFVNHASLVLIQQNFTKRLSLANGLVSSGSGAGALMLGPLLEILVKLYGFRWAFRVFALLPLLFIVIILAWYCTKRDEGGGEEEVLTSHLANNSQDQKTLTDENDTNVYERITNEDSLHISHVIPNSQSGEFLLSLSNDSSSYEVKGSDSVPLRNPEQFSRWIKIKKLFRSALQNIFDPDLLCNRSLTVFTVGFAIFLFGYFIPFTFLVDYATRKGIDITKAQLLIGILSIASTVTKILFGILMDFQKRVRRSTVMIVTLYTMALSILIIPFSTRYWHFACFSLLFGAGEGFMVGQVCTVVGDLLTHAQKHKVGAAIGNLFASMSIAVMLGPVVAGSLSTAFNSYESPFYVAAAVSFIGAITVTCVKIFEHDSLIEQPIIEKRKNDEKA